MLGHGSVTKGNLQLAVEHDDMTPEFAEILSTDEVQLSIKISRELDVDA